MNRPETTRFTEADETYMRLALRLAAEAAEEGEVPVGAVLVRDETVIGTGRNRRESRRHPLGHAEIEAIDQGCRRLGGWRLSGSTLYVTLEPCPMCAGAILNAASIGWSTARRTPRRARSGR